MGDVKKKITVASPLLWILLFPALSCVSPGPEPGSGVGFGAVQREVRLTGSGLQSTGLVVGPYRIPLGGCEFRLLLQPGGELGPEEFDLVRVTGLGSTRMECHLVGRQTPLELILLYGTRLDGPTFEKRMRLRWLGPPEQAPVLLRVVLEEMPFSGDASGGGPGQPLFLEHLFLALGAAWGGTLAQDGIALVEEHPRLSLEGGWWSSRAAVLGPSGKVRSELAFLRWLAQRRGERPLELLVRGTEKGGATPDFLEGHPVVRLIETDVETLAAAFPAAPRQEPAATDSMALRVNAPPGLRAEDPLFRKSMQVLAARGPFEGPILLAGLDPAGDPRALADTIALLRATSPDRDVLLAWERGVAPVPLWQLALTGQDPLDPGRDGPVLGQAGASLTPWRKKAAGWGPEPADRLIGALASGACRIDLGVLPAEGAAARFLAEALAWARRHQELLRSSRSLLSGESTRNLLGGGWLARRPGEALLVCCGPLKGPVEAYLPAGRSWGTILEVYPRYRILVPAPGERESRAEDAGLRVFQAWEEGTRPPQWAAAWIAEGQIPFDELPPERP